MTSRLVLDGTGDYASTPDHADLDITGDIDIRCVVALDDWTPTSQKTVFSKWSASVPADWSYVLSVRTDGTLRLQWRTTGQLEDNAFSSVAPTVSNGAILAIRATLDVNNGAGGRDVKFYTKATTGASAFADCASDSGWTQLGTTQTTGATSSIKSGAAVVAAGANEEGGSEFVAGKYYAAVVKNGIDGTTAANPDFTAQTPGATSFDDGTGKTWTLAGNAAITNPVIPTGLTSGTDSTDQSVFTTASITPTADSLVLLSVLNTKAESADTPTVTGCGLTWVAVRSKPFSTSDSYRITLFRAMGAAPTAGALTITFPSGQTGCSWAINEFGNVNTGGTNGSGAIRNDVDAISTETGTSLTATLPQIANSRNATFGCFGWTTNAAVTPGTGYTEAQEVQATAPARTLQAEYQVGKDRTVDATGPSVVAGGIAAIAVEIKVQGELQQEALTSGTDTTSQSSYATASITPSADSLQLVIVYNSKGTIADIPTVSGCGLTWVEVATTPHGASDTQRMTVFRALGAAPTPGVLTIAFSAAQLGCDWSVVEFNHVETDGTNGSGALAQSATAGGGTGTQTSLSVALDAFAAANNVAFGAFGPDADNVVTPGAGFSQLHLVRNATDTQTVLTEWKVGEDQTVDASWTSNVTAAAFGAEVVYDVAVIPEDEDSALSRDLTGTPTRRVCVVTSGEDFTALLVSDPRLADLDVEVVDCGEQSDFRVRVVDTNAEASKFMIES